MRMWFARWISQLGVNPSWKQITSESHEFRRLRSLQPAIIKAMADSLPGYSKFFNESTDPLVRAELFRVDESSGSITMRWDVCVPEDLEDFCQKENVELQDRVEAEFSASAIGRASEALTDLASGAGRLMGKKESAAGDVDGAGIAQRQIAAPVDSIVSAALHGYLQSPPSEGREVVNLFIPDEGRSLDVADSITYAKGADVDCEFICWPDRTKEPRRARLAP